MNYELYAYNACWPAPILLIPHLYSDRVIWATPGTLIQAIVEPSMPVLFIFEYRHSNRFEAKDIPQNQMKQKLPSWLNDTMRTEACFPDFSSEATVEALFPASVNLARLAIGLEYSIVED